MENLSDQEIFRNWVKQMGGTGNVARLTGYDRSNIWRYCEGKLPLPKILQQFMKISTENAQLRTSLAEMQRKNGQKNCR